MAAVNQHPEMFNQAIMVGAPFSGDINAFIDIQEGVPTGLNNQILSSDVIFTFPSVFVFLPNKDSRIADKDGKQEVIDFYSVKEWEIQQFGPFFTTKDPDQLQEMETFLGTALDHARQFRQLLEPRSIEYPAGFESSPATPFQLANWLFGTAQANGDWISTHSRG